MEHFLKLRLGFINRVIFIRVGNKQIILSLSLDLSTFVILMTARGDRDCCQRRYMDDASKQGQVYA